MESNSDFHARKSRFLKITYNLRFTIINQQQISEIARIESRFLLAKNAQLKILIRPVCGLLRDRWLLHSVLVWHQWPMTFWILYGPTQAPSTETQKCTFPHFWNIFEQFWWHIQRAAAESFHTVLISFISKKSRPPSICGLLARWNALFLHMKYCDLGSQPKHYQLFFANRFFIAFFVLSCGTLVRKTTMGGPIFVVWGIYSGAKKVSLLGGSTLAPWVIRL